MPDILLGSFPSVGTFGVWTGYSIGLMNVVTLSWREH